MSYTLAGLFLLAASPAAGNALHTEIEANSRRSKDSPLKDPESSFLLPVDRDRYCWTFACGAHFTFTGASARSMCSSRLKATLVG